MERQKQYLDLAGDFVASIGKDYRFEFINRAGRELLGVGLEHDLQAHPLYVHQFYDATTWQALADDIFPEVLASGDWSGQLKLQNTSGQSIPVRLRLLPHLDDQGEVRGLTAIGQDQRLRHALQAQEAMADRILDSTIEGIMLTDAEARIQRVNTAFTQITGYTADEILGSTPKFLRSSHHDQPFYDVMNMALRQAGRWQGEVWNRRKSGELYLQWMSVSALRNDSGETSHYMSIFHDLTEMRAKEAEIQQLAFSDPLTGLGNRYKLSQTLLHQLKPVREGGSGSALALLCIDLGQLSPINDRFGMKGGDQLIQQQARQLQRELAEYLHFYRLAGDELVALMTDATDPAKAARYADKCIRLLQVPVQLNGELIHLSPSVGIALSPKDAEDGDTLLANAQTAMIAAKQAGRDGYHFYNQALSSDLRQRLMLEQQLRLAVQPDAELGLELYLQPKVSLSSRHLLGAEVLLRWHHPDKGMISPAEFIPLAEESRLIIALDRWVFDRTCRMLNEWLQQGRVLPSISINLSARQLQEPDLVDWCVATVQRYGLQPSMLELEITETAFINLADTVMGQLGQLKLAGFPLALDDFGTGYSSLTYLRRLPLDIVKIDRSFVADICDDPRATTLLRGVMQLLDDLGFAVVAEGIETLEQAELLQHIGCSCGQGFLYHRPMPVMDFVVLLDGPM
ncbi:PAS domain S-box-containing protein/diguanylate cyclase (GGDEF)-like protein [Marinobacterium halophilum]|uniref:PAS domain S-box-containing protein/diguanylate cyclase (GGDEF)-like protein n=1 Tax=Marinobacterium halophilum TaxID=267374 RepID=A0A2P8EMZ7_9GAMM|nr:bifunctional diguanylate cyclase/phosphodiesterase [Marinobacterium halophilum]PSL10857.1 PAS domain S-box-containing protein/diguanylate cyclase (GGDEF)-like protein [Marinobacterium halophilum]